MRKSSNAFTLIELLVVIAIIAILASILFPVFAQAKSAAKNTTDLSGTKELTLGVIMYAGDVDDNYPFAIRADWNATWATVVFPYVKNNGVFRSPFDSSQYDKGDLTGWQPPRDWLNGWAGIPISFGVNAYYHPQNSLVTQSCGCTGHCVPSGLFVPMVQPDACPGSWFTADTISSTQVTKPGETIMLADKFDYDAIAQGGDGNTSSFFGSPEFCIQCTQDSGNWNWAAPVQIPDGTRPLESSSNPFPKGPRGAISLTNANHANFSFADGHSKTLNPVATDPDPVNQPLNNMWNSLR
ncbi:MAG: prepilin-type N-terminal cleavage/methylation domain-containing protein [Fimbriimonas sp.]|nr:prepilin-type N-terminal cleavage/methylation domain-containing protein [Fimbriimonas sp.]